MKRPTTSFLFGYALAVLPALCSPPPEAISPKARALHFSAVVIDTHDDTTQRLLDPTFDLGVRHADGGIDIPRMREGGLNALFFSIWIPGTITGPKAVEQALAQIEAIRRQARLHPRDLVLATTAKDIYTIRREFIGDHRIHPRRVGHIELNRFSLPARRAERSHHFVGRGLPACVGHDNFRPLRGEHLGDGLSDSPRRPGHQRNFTSQRRCRRRRSKCAGWRPTRRSWRRRFG